MKSSYVPFMFALLLLQLSGTRGYLDYQKLWKPPSNRGFLPCTKPTPKYTSKELKFSYQVVI